MPMYMDFSGKEISLLLCWSCDWFGHLHDSKQNAADLTSGMSAVRRRGKQRSSWAVPQTEVDFPPCTDLLAAVVFIWK